MLKSWGRIEEYVFFFANYCHTLSLDCSSLSGFIRFRISLPSSCITVELQIWIMTVIITEPFSNPFMGLENVLEWALPMGPCSHPQNYSSIGDNQDTEDIDKNSFFWRTAIGRIFLSGKKQVKIKGTINNSKLVKCCC